MKKTNDVYKQLLIRDKIDIPDVFETIPDTCDINSNYEHIKKNSNTNQALREVNFLDDENGDENENQIQRADTSTPYEELNSDCHSVEEFQIVSSSDSNNARSKKRKSESEVELKVVHKDKSPPKRKKVILKGLIDFSQELLDDNLPTKGNSKNSSNFSTSTKVNKAGNLSRSSSKNLKLNQKLECQRILFKVEKNEAKSYTIDEKSDDVIKSSHSSVDQVVPTSGTNEWDLMSSSSSIIPSWTHPHKRKKKISEKRKIFHKKYKRRQI
ncbi:DgyrCDS5607 [Dimorphilus gyrociliatus]|nr:DgyrCDS5607 [Dimorphilus gyrociliatus]